MVLPYLHLNCARSAISSQVKQLRLHVVLERIVRRAIRALPLNYVLIGERAGAEYNRRPNGFEIGVRPGISDAALASNNAVFVDKQITV